MTKLNKIQKGIIENRLKELKKSKVTPYFLLISGFFFLLSILGSIIGIILIIIAEKWLSRIKKEETQLKIQYGMEIPKKKHFWDKWR